MLNAMSFLRLRFFVITIVLCSAAGRAGESAVQEISFNDLSFAVTPPKQVELEGAVVPQPSYAEQLPERVRALDGQRVRLRGFMMPTRLEDEGVREFLIVTSPLVCCFGQTPEVYEFILVKMAGEPAPMRENMPAFYEGVLRVGDIYEQGYWTGLFALECERVADE
jgi:hypothetical protein